MNRRQFLAGAAATVSVSALKSTTAIVAAEEVVRPGLLIDRRVLDLLADVARYGTAIARETEHGVERIDPLEFRPLPEDPPSPYVIPCRIFACDKGPTRFEHSEVGDPNDWSPQEFGLARRPTYAVPEGFKDLIVIDESADMTPELYDRLLDREET